MQYQLWKTITHKAFNVDSDMIIFNYILAFRR